ncbi:DUF5060 domain-containing protein [Robiginitalea sediminis]|uniref:DUF5060 domain-containing protein n=1 Tax=Robiginitalea sediminis TaxID=1982593 RepID=UPI000B4BB867|nr:DUF5060 domain-containing protein [Robiginitalea sediminis]
MRIKTTLLLFACLFAAGPFLRAQSAILGETKRWHAVRLQFQGPQTSEVAQVNPFMDYRLEATFTAPDGRTFNVPGFYAADGNAAQTGSSTGNIWEVRFTPDQTGTWNYTISFRNGPQIAIDANPSAGTPVFFDGTTGTLSIAASDKSALDFRGRGRLSYNGTRYLRFEGDGTYFLKAGADSPENLLASSDFDNTVPSKTWSPHAGDWNSGDPTWKNGKGKGLIGAVNYLSGKGMNAMSFLTMNVIGDGKDVWPWTSSTHSGLDGTGGQDEENRMRYDVSKLEQWEILFSHAQRKGLFLHFKTQETENDQLLDGGDLGPTRKLYYRELVARFGHHLALNWNLGEEHDLYQELGDTNNNRIKAYASYIKGLDPYDHHIVVHSYPSNQDDLYMPLLGESDLTGPSLQIQINDIHKDVKRWIENSRNSGKAWVVTNDEQGDAQTGVTADASYSGKKGTQADNRKAVRHKTLWGTLMAGGAGVEYYFGYQTGETDLTAEDWRSRKTKWEDAKRALDFFNTHLSFWEMESRDDLVANNASYCLAKPGNTYAVYLPNGGTDNLDLSNTTGTFSVKWFNPRTGGSLRTGSKATLQGGGVRGLGTAPESANEDWVVLVEYSGEGSGGGSGGSSGACEATYEEQGGRLIIEAENLPLAAGWQTRTAAEGYTGSGYIEWTGGNFFNAPGNGQINVPIKINTPGTYRFEWRSKVGEGTNSTESNDSWLRFPDADDFYGDQNGHLVYPIGSGKTPNPNGAGSEGWFKVFLSGTINWTWSTNTSDNDGHKIYVEFDTPGVYTLQVSGRSNHHLIDRMTLSLEAEAARDLGLAETLCDSGSGEEPIGVTGIQVTPESAGLAIGETLALNATVTPNNATDASVSWSSSDESVATVSATGVVTALSPGMATITARTTDGGFTASSQITVPEPPGGEEPEEEPGEESPMARISGSDTEAVEGRELVFEVILDRPLEQPLNLVLVYEDIDTEPSDYAPLTETLEFAPGITSATLVVPTVSDRKRETSESFLIRVAETEGPEVSLPEILARGTILDDDQQMKISPNPASPYADIAFSNVQEGTYQVEIYTAAGTLKQMETLEVGSGEPSLRLRNLSRGLYVVKLNGIEYSYTAKLLVR